MPLDPNDGGIWSRKLWITVGACLLATGCWLLTGRYPALAPTYGELLGGISGLIGLFMVGNVATKHFIAKSMANVSFQGEMPGSTATAPAKPAAKAADAEEGS